MRTAEPGRETQHTAQSPSPAKPPARRPPTSRPAGRATAGASSGNGGRRPLSVTMISEGAGPPRGGRSPGSLAIRFPRTGPRTNPAARPERTQGARQTNPAVGRHPAPPGGAKRTGGARRANPQGAPNEPNRHPPDDHSGRAERADGRPPNEADGRSPNEADGRPKLLPSLVLPRSHASRGNAILDAPRRLPRAPRAREGGAACRFRGCCSVGWPVAGATLRR